MKWTDSGGGADFVPPPVGTHVARCVRLIDLGTQKSDFNGQESVKRQCLLGFELPTELMEGGEYDGKPFVVSKFYTQSLHEKATLRKDLETWRGRSFTPVELEGFDSRNVLAKPCLVSVIHNKKSDGKISAKVSSVTSVPKGMQVPAQVNPSVYFSLDEFDQAVFDALSDGIKKIIVRSPEYQAILKRANGVGDPYDADWKPGDEPVVEDEIPF